MSSADGRGERTVFLVVGDEAERLLRLGLWAVTAASIGERVEVLLSSGPLRAWIDGEDGPFDTVRPHARDLGLPTPRGLLLEAKALGPLRIVTCDTEWRLAGVAEEDVRRRVDEIVSLPTFWRETAGARIVTI
jgi:peroxiredoxin family protein